MNKIPTEFNAFLTLLAILIFLELPGCVSHEATPELSNDTLRIASSDHILFKEKDTTDLMFQSAKGDIVQVKKLLKEGAGINQANINGYTALMFAAEWGNLSIAQLLIENGANIHKKTTRNHTALFLASSHILPRARPFPKDFVNSGSPYVGENDHMGVIDYLISIDAPIFESLGYIQDAEFTANAFYNIATIYESHADYPLAQQNYEVAMKSFLLVYELNDKTSALYKAKKAFYEKKIREYRENEVSWLPAAATLAKALLPVLEAANQRYQNKGMADAFAIRDAKKHNLNTQQFLSVRRKYLEALEKTPNFPPTVITPNTVNVPKPTTDGGEGHEKMKAAIKSGFDVYQLKSKHYYEQATNIGIILECYKNEIADESFASCLEWPKKEFVYHGKEPGRQVLKIYDRSE